MRLRDKNKYIALMALLPMFLWPGNPKFEHYTQKSEEFKNEDFVKAKLYADSALKLAGELRDLTLIARAYNELANVYCAHARYADCKAALESADHYIKKSDNKLVRAAILNNWGIYYERTANYNKSAEMHLKALAIRQELKDEKQTGASYQNLGAVYFYMGDYKQCEKNTLKAIEIAEKYQLKKLLGELYDNLGACYFSDYQDSLASIYLNKSLVMALETKNKLGIENSYNNLAAFYVETGKPFLAKSYLFRAMENLSGSPERYNSILQTLGSVYQKTNKPDSALYYYNEALKLAKSTGNRHRARNIYKDLSNFYFLAKDFENAYLMQQEYHRMDDSLRNAANVKDIAELEAVYKTEKQAREIELLNAQNKIEKEKTESNRKLLWISLAGLLIALIAAFSFYRHFIRKKKDNVLLQEKNAEIQKQKDLIAEKNKEIVDSITYAKRLQEAILPPLELIQKNLPQSFVLYLPKDIVAGDFYWTHISSDPDSYGEGVRGSENKSSYQLLAVADCTGHGVPGAMVSVVCANALNAAVKEFGLKSPSKILDKVNELVEETFAKSSSEVKDGMDISLIKIEAVNDNPENKLQKGKLIIPKGKSLTDVLESNKRYRIEWAGANNPLWYIKEGIWHEIKADKQPVGKFENRKAFTSHEFELKSGDSFFLISDGFADQFGGSDGKKIKNKALKELLFRNSGLPAWQQKEVLEKEFSSWKGSYEQVDDVCVMGVRL